MLRLSGVPAPAGRRPGPLLDSGDAGSGDGATLRRAVAALSIVVVAALLIHAIAERKNEDLAGPATYPLGEEGPEREALEALLSELERLGRPELANRLHRLDAEGAIWVAPYMPAGAQALYVDSLGLVERIYVERSALLLEELPFADAGLPEEWRHLYAVIKLGGTLYHELQHLDGVLDEAEAYRREEAWYAGIARSGYVRGLDDEAQRRYTWAIESAALGAREAARKAAAAAGSDG